MKYGVSQRGRLQRRRRAIGENQISNSRNRSKLSTVSDSFSGVIPSISPSFIPTLKPSGVMVQFRLNHA
jgi:hypothetical protein